MQESQTMAVALTMRAVAFFMACCICQGSYSSDNSTVEIAPGVKMPFLNAGIGNRTLWVEAGGRGLDTAATYQDDDQKKTGEVIHKSGLSRSDLFVTTKVPCCPPPHADCRIARAPSENTTANLQYDLDMLDVPWVDVMLMHWPCFTLEQTIATWRHLEEFFKQGKARAIGVSNFNASLLERFIPLTKVKPAVNQVGFSVGGHSPVETEFGRDEPTLAKCKELGITLTAYSPLGHVTKVDVLHDPTVVDIAKAHNRSTAEIALRWLVQRGIPLVTSTTSWSHAESDLRSLQFELSVSEMERLSAVSALPIDTVIEI